MLGFDTTLADNGGLPLEVTDGMTGRQFLFKIQGIMHGSTVFSDMIHYILKGGKLMKCSLASINKYRKLASEARNAQVSCRQMDK